MTFARWQRLLGWLPAFLRAHVFVRLPARLQRRAWVTLRAEVERARVEEIREAGR